MDKLIIYQTHDNKTVIEVSFDEETVWLTQQQMAALFGRDRKTITRHIQNVFKEEELVKEEVCSYFEHTAADNKKYRTQRYNLDVIISVGYRVKSQQGTQFRQWATSRLKDYLVEGYTINKKRLAEKNMEVKTLKTGIQILSTTLKEHITTIEEAKGLAVLLDQFDKGLTLLDDYDHEHLDNKGTHSRTAKRIELAGFKAVINAMKSDFASDIFGRQKPCLCRW